MKISDIKIGNRFRKEFGNIQQLAASIKEIGLLQPPGIDENNNLIFGMRRIEAYKYLGYDEIPVHVIPIKDIRKGEIDENVVRQNFTWEEIMAIQKELEPEIKAQTKEGRPRKNSSNLDQFRKGRVDEKLAKYITQTGNKVSRNTLRAVTTVYENRDKYPEEWERLNQGKSKPNNALISVNRHLKAEELKKQGGSIDWVNSESIMITSSNGKVACGFRKPKGMKISDGELADIRRQIDEHNKPYWWLTEEEKQIELQKDKEYEEFDKKHSEPYYGIDYTTRKRSKIPTTFIGKKLETGPFDRLLKPTLSKKEIIDWLLPMDDAARFHVNISYAEKFPPHKRPQNPGYTIKSNKLTLVTVLLNADMRDPTVFHPLPSLKQGWTQVGDEILNGH